MATSRRGIGKVKARSRRGQGKVEMQGQGKINVRLQQSNCIPNHNNNLMGLGTIEINLLSFIIKCVIHYLIIRVMNHYLSISVIPKLLSKDQITVESSQSSIHLQHNLILSCIKKRYIYGTDLFNASVDLDKCRKFRNFQGELYIQNFQK